MIQAHEALRLLEEDSRPLETVELPLGRARGSVLAEPVSADRDFPPTDRSAMDGFAVRSADVPGPGRRLTIVGELRAGQPVGETRVEPGQAVRIFTGSVVPPGADAVVMVERTQEEPDGRVRIDVAPGPGHHIRKRGEERREGDTVLEAGAPIHAAEVAALAAVGRVSVPVHRTPVVHVLGTGDEVIPADRAPLDHQVRNSNAWALLAQLHELGIAGEDSGIAPDNASDLAERIRRGLEGDMLLITGGVSVGAYDLVGAALAEAGMQVLFHKVAVRPGKPILAGRCGSCRVFGLPGNPVSAYTGFAVFVAPVIRRLMGCRRWANLEVRAVLEEPLRVRPGRQTYHLACMGVSGGAFVARPVKGAGSGDVLSLVRANGFLVTPADATDQPTGSELPALLWRDFHLRT